MVDSNKIKYTRLNNSKCNRMYVCRARPLYKDLHQAVLLPMIVGIIC